MPSDPPTTLCMLYIRGLVLGLLSDVLQATNSRRPGNEASARTDNYVLRVPHQSPLYMHAPPFFNLWIRPCSYRDVRCVGVATCAERAVNLSPEGERGHAPPPPRIRPWYDSEKRRPARKQQSESLRSLTARERDRQRTARHRSRQTTQQR